MTSTTTPTGAGRRARCARVAGLAAAAVVGASLLAAPAVAAAAVPGATRAAASCIDDTGPKFDAHHGAPDAAIGIPGEDIRAIKNTGMVQVRYGCGSKLKGQGLHMPTPHSGDLFGTAVAELKLNLDGYSDLLVGAPGMNVNGVKDAGGVVVFHGSRTGLRYVRTLVQSTKGVPGSVQAGARFGAAISTYADFDGPNGGYRHVRIGVPGLDVGAAVDAGGYVDLTYTQKGKAVPALTRQVTLNSAGIPGTAAKGDLLGSSLFTVRSVGAPGRKVNGHAGAGAVLSFDGPTPVLVTQDTPGVPDVAEAGDHFGAALAGRWIGVPGEDLGGLADAGMVERFDPDPAYRVALTQNSPGVDGTAEAGDRFGAALAELANLVDDSIYNPIGLLVGAPGEDVGTARDVGVVDVLRQAEDEGIFYGTTGDGAVSVPGHAAGSRFGTAIAPIALTSDRARVGAPGADHGAGLVITYTQGRGSAPAPPVRGGTWRQTDGSPESGDGFGSSIQASSW